MARPFLSALAIAGLLAVTLWGIVVMVRNSLAVVERNNLAAAAPAADREGAMQGAAGQMTGAGGRIAFAQNGRIAVAMGNGVMPAFLTRGSDDHSPVWSPDGAKLAFVSAGMGERTGLYVIQVAVASMDAMDERRVAPAAALYSRPSWSPDSRRLVFRDAVKERQGIYTVNADGTDLKRIFQGNANAPVWSPDGRWITFTFNPGPTQGGLYLTDPDGANAKVVLGGVFSDVAWSPDSAALAVRGLGWLDGQPKSIKGALATEQVLLVERSSGKATVLTAAAGGGTWSPVWSPDGTSLAFVAGRDGGQQLMVMSRDGGPARALMQGAGLIDPVWSPDGSELAVGIAAGSDADALVQLVRADGSGARNFAPGEFPAWAR